MSRPSRVRKGSRTEIERFMRAAGALTAPDPAAVMALAERHGIEMT